jgi:hypothetical protein
MSILRAPVLIIGAHRSGTSATARALELLGLQIGEKLDSHRESKPLQRLHETYLQRCGAAWYHPAPFLERIKTAEGERDCLEYLRGNVRARFARIFGYRKNPKGLWQLARIKFGSVWGWKEPRTTLFAPVWLQLFPDARIIHVVRHPLAVAMSIQQRERKFRASGDAAIPQLATVEDCARLALIYVEQGERVAALTSHYQRVRFEDLQANPSKVIADLAGFCGLTYSRAQLLTAAASIRPESPLSSDDAAASLLTKHPLVAKLGYGGESATLR